MQFSDVTDLPGPPLLDRLLFISPLPTALAVLFVGLVLFEVLRRRGKSRAGLGALATAFGLASVVWLIGYRVETPYEKVHRATERFVDRATVGDRDGVEALLAPRFQLVLSEDDSGRDADWMLDRVAGLGEIVASNQRVWRGGEMKTKHSAVTRMTVRTELKVAGFSGRYASTWDFSWQRGEDGAWRLIRLEAMSIVGQRPWRGWGDQAPVPAGRSR